MWTASEEDSTFERSSPPSYFEAQDSLAHDNSGPSLSILFQLVVTRGDIEPFLSVASELKRRRHKVRVATFKESQDLIEDRSLEFFDIGGDAAELICDTLTNATWKLPMDNNERHRRRALQNMLELCWQACIKPGPCESPGSEATEDRLCNEEPFVADVIIANPLAFAHIHCAERLGIPLHIIPTYI